jgi:hypothetical protein
MTEAKLSTVVPPTEPHGPVLEGADHVCVATGNGYGAGRGWELDLQD